MRRVEWPVDGLEFVKGHGTENDFVVVADPDGALELPADLVAAICDRRRGIGADGLLRVVRTAAVPEASAAAGAAEWFMDYRNADGSLAEMCGNGARVFVRYLLAAGLADLTPAGPPLPVATRGGVRSARLEPTGEITVDLGRAELPERLAAVEVTTAGRTWPATGVLLPNPHAVAVVADLADAGALTGPPAVAPAAAYPDGVNVEFVLERGPHHIALRVHERGVGETRSCGTGAAAATVVARRRAGRTAADDVDRAWTVDVPGGRLTVTERADATLALTGPAVLVASGRLDPDWLRSATGQSG